MSEIEERLIYTPKQELEYQKRKNSELLSYAAKNHKLIEELLARAENAEAALESAQKMCDNWEKKAAERQGQVCEWKEKAGKLFDQYAQVRDALENAEALRDEWKRRAGNAETELSRSMNMLSCSPEFLRSEKPRPIDWPRVPVDWGRVRIDAAIAAMQGLFAGKEVFMGPMEVIAVECADALVAELQKKEVQE